MSLDRTGEAREPVDESAPWHDPRCGGGWLGHDDELRPIPCPVCRPWTVTRSTVTETTPSLRAQAAIRAEENRR